MHGFRLYGLLVGLSVTVLLCCDALAFKVVTILGFNFSASGLIFPIDFLLACVLTDSYGYNLAGRVIWIQIISQAIFIFIINLFVLLPSSNSDPISLLYYNLYKHIWRVLIASSIAVTIAYFLNDFIMSKLKIYYQGKLFFIRLLVSTALGQTVLVSISYPINLFGIFSFGDIFNIALNTWFYKMLVAIIFYPVALLMSKFVKRFEGIDYYDYGISYNPLSVFSSTSSGNNKYD